MRPNEVLQESHIFVNSFQVEALYKEKYYTITKKAGAQKEKIFAKPRIFLLVNTGKLTIITLGKYRGKRNRDVTVMARACSGDRYLKRDVSGNPKRIFCRHNLFLNEVQT
jgi:hypothetical protein